jgi:hypothetical protein
MTPGGHRLTPRVIKDEIITPKVSQDSSCSQNQDSPQAVNMSPKIFNCEKIVKKASEEIAIKTSSKKIFKIEKFSNKSSGQGSREHRID